jgi:hypothetical protein
MKAKVKIASFMILLGALSATFSCDDDPEVVLSGEKDILSFTVPGQTGPPILNASNLTVVAEVECGTDLTSIAPTFTLSEGATSSIASGAMADYSSQVTITVTAEDGTAAAWKVTISEACANSADILSFSLVEETGPADIDNSSHTIEVEVEYDTDLTSLTPTFTLSSGATSDPVSETTGDYSSAVTITVTAQDGTTQDWTVNVTEAPPAPSDATNILVFLLEDQTTLATIDQNNHSVAIEVVNSTDLTILTPIFKVSPGASSDPESATAGNYSSAVIITVIAEDATTTQDWTINVSEAAPGVHTGTDILSFSVPEQSQEPVIDGANHKVFVEVSEGTVLTNLAPTFLLSPGATSVPVSGTAGDYSSNVTIAVTAEDGTSTQDWIVEVYLEAEFDASIFCNENLCATNDELQQECQNFLLSCLATQDQKDYDECLISALLFCHE